MRRGTLALLLTWADVTFSSLLTGVVHGSVAWSVEFWITSTFTLVMVAIIDFALRGH